MIKPGFNHICFRGAVQFVRFFSVLIVLYLSQLAISNPASAQSRIPHSQFVIDHWGVNDGLPVNNVMKLHQSRDGYLWMVTFDGLVRFDGLNFKIYQTVDYPWLPTNRFVKLYEGLDGSLWIVSEQRFLIRFKNNRFTHIQESDGLNGNLVYDVHLDDNGYLWFGTDRGVSFFDGEELKPYHPSEIEGTIDRVFTEQTGAIWIRNLNTLENFRFDGGEMSYVFTSPNSYHFNPVVEEENGRVWFSSFGDMYSFKDDSLFYCCSVDQFLENEEYQPLAENAYSVSSFHRGNFSFTNNIGRHYTPQEGEISSLNSIPLISKSQPFIINNQSDRWMISTYYIHYNDELVLHIENGISSTLFDREGNFWVATGSEGLYLIKTNPFQTWSTAEGLPGQNIYPILEDREGIIWVGTFGQGIARISNNRVEKISGSEGTVLSFFQKADGTLLTGYFNEGYFVLDSSNNRLLLQQEPAETIGADVYAIFEQNNGDLWLGTSTGLFVQQDSEWKKMNSDSGFTESIVRYFHEAPDGSLWMATNIAGIVRYKNGGFDHYEDENGIGSNLIRSLFIEPGSDPENYVLWVGSEDQGLFRLQVRQGEPQFQTVTQYDPSDGMLDYVIHVILMDDEQNFWFNTNRGIFKVPKKELEAFHKGEISSIEGVAFTENDGLRNREGNGGTQPAGTRASDGSIWLPGQDGVTRFDPDSIVTNTIPPPVIIEEIRTIVDTYILPSDGTVSLSADQRDFELHFSALSFVEPAKNIFRYRLRGYNDSWIDAGNRRMATYTNIPDGNYTFEVMGSNNAGTWNPEPAVVAIVVAPFFYETKWFAFLVLLAAALLIYGGVRLRVRRLEQDEHKLKQLVKEKTSQLRKEKKITEKQAEDLKELDRAKTRFFTNISHELRTPLTLIISPLQQALSNGPRKYTPPEREELLRMLRNGKRLLRLIDQTLELTKLEQGKLKLHVQEIDVKDFLNGLVELFNPLCKEKEISLSCSVPDPEQTVFADPYKLDNIVGNLLSNAIKFTPAGGEITVEATEDDDHIFISVSDTGSGISAEDQLKIFDRFYQVSSSETRDYEGSGIGLSVAHDFAKLHHGSLRVDSEPGKGSVFTLSLKKGSAHFTKDELQEYKEPYFYNRIAGKTLSAELQAKSIPQSGDDQTTVLVVEDNGDMRSFIREVLEESYRVLEAENGSKALKVVTEQLPDLIVADIMMPEMDGITFNRKIKENPNTASVPLVFLTAKTARTDQLEGLGDGADDYITKPFDPLLLKARVDNLIESRLRLRHLLQSNHQEKNPSEISFSSTLNGAPFLNEVRSILEKQFSNPEFQVASLAKELNLSRSYMTRKLKKKTGLTPSELIKTYRMEKASLLLKEKSGNISEVAYAVGYKSLAYFSHIFREQFDCSPSEFLKNI